MPAEHWLRLALTDGIGPVLAAQIVARLGSSQAACEASSGDLAGVEGIGRARAAVIAASLRNARDRARAELDRAASMGVRLVCPDDRDYPPLLREIPDPPCVLWMRGTLEPRDLNALAIVGSRRCSLYGREQADRFAALLAGAGFTLVSGGARGIDSAAHRAAIRDPAGRTVAVLGCGIDVDYPPENRSLLEQIAERGAVLSEYPPETAPLPEHFPRRNRIVSGMSRGVLVIEADLRSGALITARIAIDDHNRPVLAIPGRVDNPQSAGPHKLIRDGAALVSSLEHILDALGGLSSSLPNAPREPDVSPITPTPPPPAVSPLQQTILDALSDPGDIDALIERTGLTAPQIIPQITFLTLRGRITRDEQGLYRRRTL